MKGFLMQLVRSTQLFLVYFNNCFILLRYIITEYVNIDAMI